MKKSDQYTIAMMAVVDNPNILTAAKIEVLETLMADKRMAEYGEEAEKDAALS